MRWEMVIFVLRFRARGNCWEKLPCPESQAMGCLFCQQETLLQPLTAKLAAKGLERGATTEHNIELGLAGLGHPRKTQWTGWRWWTGVKEVFSSATLIAAKLLPDPDLSEASALHYFGWRWWWMLPAPHWARPSPGFSLFHWEIGERGGKDSW